jgi:ParB family chromosome partitioning protein
MAKPRLGKGIAALLPEPTGRGQGVVEVPVASIEPNPLQPRRTFSEAGLEELANSLREVGMLQPVVVTRGPSGGYVLLAGERRWRAARKAGLATIPAVVRDAAGDSEALALALIENLQREDLTPIEEARAYHHLRAELGLSQEDIARRVGKDRSTVANALRLLQLPLSVQELVDAGALSAGHGRALAALEDAEKQRQLAQQCVAQSWSVRQLEARLHPRARRSRAQRLADADTRAAEERLAAQLGARVEIRRRRRGGELVIGFRTEAELIQLFKRLTGEE